MKEITDKVISAVGLILLLPLLALLAALIRFFLGSPIVFFQQRPGKNGVVFQIYKFRSMSDAKDSEGRLLPDDERLGKFGRLLRASSLDELPALWNVLKGDMSLVGPRPLLVEYLPLYSKEQARRHDLKPGVTGWAQVNGRNSISWEEKFELDVWYVENQSFWLDLKILFLTVKKVLVREGISSDSSATMEKFKG